MRAFKLWAEFIIKYWLQFALGIVAAILAAGHKKIKERFDHYRDLHEAERDKDLCKNMTDAMKPMLDELAHKSDSNDAAINGQLAEMAKHMEQITDRFEGLNGQLNTVTEGVLNVQGSVFKRECRDLLRADEISEESYEVCMHDHTVYNKLGGNHEGDQLFQLVTAKYEGQLKK